MRMHSTFFTRTVGTLLCQWLICAGLQAQHIALDQPVDNINKWILHNPSDDRKTLFIAHYVPGLGWDWAKNFMFKSNGDLGVKGVINTEGGRFSSFYSGNTDGIYPGNAINVNGDSQLSIGANWTAGYSDLSLINSNLSNTTGGGISLWQMTGAGSKRMLAYFMGNGSMGLGVVPQTTFQVSAVTPVFRLGNNTGQNVKVNQVISSIEFPTSAENLWMAKINAGVGNYSDQPYLTFHTGAQSSEQLRITPAGSVGIGTADPGTYKLAVEGKVGAREVEVKVGSWADFVFKPTYRLRSLSEVEGFIGQHGHLPEIPSESEVKAQGISLGEMNRKLLQKIEELTLYLIEQQRRIEQLEERMDGQQTMTDKRRRKQ